MPPPPPGAPTPSAGGVRRGGGPGRMRGPEPLDIQRKFDLRKMLFDGKLEL